MEHAQDILGTIEGIYPLVGRLADYTATWYTLVQEDVAFGNIGSSFIPNGWHLLLSNTCNSEGGATIAGIGKFAIKIATILLFIPRCVTSCLCTVRADVFLGSSAVFLHAYQRRC
jgi:hypothetical protein